MKTNISSEIIAQDYELIAQHKAIAAELQAMEERKQSAQTMDFSRFLKGGAS